MLNRFGIQAALSRAGDPLDLKRVQRDDGG
jgi:hypothetical protein